VADNLEKKRKEAA